MMEPFPNLVPDSNFNSRLTELQSSPSNKGFRWSTCIYKRNGIPMISMGVSIFHSKSAILAILTQKVRKSAFLRTFLPQNALFRPFRSKTLKTGMGQKCCSSQCFFRCFGGHFRKKAQNGGFLAFWAVLTTFGGQKTAFAPKKRKSAKKRKRRKSIIFAPSAKQ